MPDPTDLPESAYDVAYEMLSMREPERADVVAAVDAVVAELGLTVELLPAIRLTQPDDHRTQPRPEMFRLAGPYQPVKGDDS